MKNFKNQSAEILMAQRPLLQLKDAELSALLIHAEFMAHKSIEAEEADPESFSAKIQYITAIKMMSDVAEEAAWRN